MRPDGDSSVRAGSLRHVITIQRQVEDNGIDDAGAVTSWEDIFIDVPASVEPDRAVDSVADGQTVSETFIPVTIRYMDGVKANMRVISEFGNYIIRGIVNVGERRRMLELQCLAIGLDD
jgi:head-tail adaptor